MTGSDGWNMPKCMAPAGTSLEGGVVAGAHGRQLPSFRRKNLVCWSEEQVQSQGCGGCGPEKLGTQRVINSV